MKNSLIIVIAPLELGECAASAERGWSKPYLNGYGGDGICLWWCGLSWANLSNWTVLMKRMKECWSGRPSPAERSPGQAL